MSLIHRGLRLRPRNLPELDLTVNTNRRSGIARAIAACAGRVRALSRVPLVTGRSSFGAAPRGRGS
jgi:hypothetical protein